MNIIGTQVQKALPILLQSRKGGEGNLLEGIEKGGGWDLTSAMEKLDHAFAELP
jgi:hypothetical protein